MVLGLPLSSALIKAVKRNSGQSLKKRKTRALNQATLETQDKSSDIAMIMGRLSLEASERDTEELGTVLRPPASTSIETFDSNLHQYAPDQQIPLDQRSLERHGIHGAHPSNVQSSMKCLSKQSTFKTPRPSILPGNTQSANALCKQEPPFVAASM
ncbi:hypothetical protein O181_040429 [Austropuccinia psidii MF-1]|uniref:Uncharacterized protein n=1 Tax=Austropuccinia psidii MF-1 TaxID=1389203 RepID=A0A9Q3DCE6_9BASI|nr:hypothetical protein [Austropuccinia psidii MF-1]